MVLLHNCFGWSSCAYFAKPRVNTCRSSGCTYICSCTFTYTFTPATPAPSCVQCVPPPAPNAITPQTVLGAESYTWTCAKGYWATPVTRSCLTATDALGNPQWSLQEINCVACIAPSKPQNGWVSRDPISLDTVSDSSMKKLRPYDPCSSAHALPAVVCWLQRWVLLQLESAGSDESLFYNDRRAFWGATFMHRL